VLVTGNKIIAAGPRGQISVPAGATTINLPGTTLTPGLIDAHSRLLHPYNETSWNDQVLHESLALRTACGHLKRRCGLHNPARPRALRARDTPTSDSSRR
jgi:imidazolonepropionase-like amidohydrolase